MKVQTKKKPLNNWLCTESNRDCGRIIFHNATCYHYTTQPIDANGGQVEFIIILPSALPVFRTNWSICTLHFRV